MIQRPPAGTIPDTPGSYQFKDVDGRVIYVGKAKSLRSRLANYFANPATLAPRTAQMVATAATVEWIQVRNDVEALMLEYSLIKQHQPGSTSGCATTRATRFLAVTMDDEWPRPTVMRGRRRKGVRYFGPYAHAYAIRETLDLLVRIFPCAPAATTSSPITPASAGRASCSTSRSARVRVWARSTSRPTTSWSPSCWSSSTATPTRSSRSSKRRCARLRASSSTSGPRVCAIGSPPYARPSSGSRWWPIATKTST